MCHVEILHRDLEPVKAAGDLLAELFHGCGVAILHELHQGVDLLGDPCVLLDLPVRRNIHAGNVGILLLSCLYCAVEIVESPDHDRDLAAHVVDIILDLERVAGLSEGAGKRVADDRVPDMPDMEGAVRVRAGVLEHDPRGFLRQVAVAGLDRVPERLADVCIPEDKVDDRALLPRS